MESIKITDKLSLRQEALRMAIKNYQGEGFGSEKIKTCAKEFERYLLGNSDLPERDNSMEKYLQELKNSVLNFKSNPWIPADDEMKPAKDVQVVCALHYGKSSIVYQTMRYDHDEKIWYDGADEDNTNHVVAWRPIPEYQPTKM